MHIFLLPLLFFLGLYLFFIKKENTPILGLHKTVLLFLSLTYFSTEFFSFFGLLSISNIKLLWECFSLLGLLSLFYNRKYIKKLSFNFIFKHKLLIFLFVIVFLLLTFSAYIFPVSSWDGNIYHWSRIEQWFMRGSVGHFGANDSRQLMFPPLLEYLCLHVKYLSDGGDEFYGIVSIVIWFLACLSPWTIYESKKFSFNQAFLAMIFIGFTPLAILQAPTAKNDLLYLYLYSVFLINIFLLEQNYWMIGISAGLCFLTKSLAPFYVTPFLILKFLEDFIKEKTMKFIIVIFIVSMFISPTYIRNYNTFGNVFTEPAWHSFIAIDLNSLSVKRYLTNLFMIIYVHFATQYANANFYINDILKKVILFFHLNPFDPIILFSSMKKHRLPPSNFSHPNHDTTASFFIVFVFLFSRLKKMVLGLCQYKWIYLIPLILFLIFAGLFKWNPWMPRLFLPLMLFYIYLFVLTWPLIGKRTLTVIFILFIMSSYQLILSPFGEKNLIFRYLTQKSRDKIQNTLYRKRFGHNYKQYNKYNSIVDAIKNIPNCYIIGIKWDPGSLPTDEDSTFDYPFYWMLNSNKSVIEYNLNYINIINASKKYEDPVGVCAIIRANYAEDPLLIYHQKLFKKNRCIHTQSGNRNNICLYEF